MRTEVVNLSYEVADMGRYIGAGGCHAKITEITKQIIPARRVTARGLCGGQLLTTKNGQS